MGRRGEEEELCVSFKLSNAERLSLWGGFVCLQSSSVESDGLVDTIKSVQVRELVSHSALTLSQPTHPPTRPPTPAANPI